MVDIYEYLRYTANLIASSKFGNKIILKGGTVLISKLVECNRMDLYRLTSDLDIHCDKKEVWIDFYNDIENILNNNDRGYIYKLENRRSSEKELVLSDSLKFSLHDHGMNINFKMDMNIKSNRIITVDYSPILNMNTYDAATMLSDKIVATSSEKIYRRIKDLYDIAVLSSIYSFKYYEVMGHLKVKHPDTKLENKLIVDNFDKLEHAYNKYTGITNKRDIRELIAICCTFLEPIYLGYSGEEMVWNLQTARWEKC